MLKQMQGFDTNKVEVGQFVKIKRKGQLFNGLITCVTDETLAVYVYLSSKFIEEKDRFQNIYVWAKEVISVDANGAIPVVSTDTIHPDLTLFMKEK